MELSIGGMSKDKKGIYRKAIEGVWRKSRIIGRMIDMEKKGKDIL